MSSEALRLPSLTPSKAPLVVAGEIGRKNNDSGYDTAMTKITRIAQNWKKTAMRPGDVYRPAPGEWGRPRPLGLIPERDKYIDPYALYLELTRPPISSVSDTIIPLLKRRTTREHVSPPEGDRQGFGATRSANLETVAKKHVESNPQSNKPAVPYRLNRISRDTTQHDLSSALEDRIQEVEQYESLVRMAELTMAQKSRTNLRTLPPTRPPPHMAMDDVLETKPPANTPDISSVKDVQGGRTRSTSAPLFFSFVNQAQVNHRLLSDDQRYAKDYIPCERCRIRGGRCRQCRAIRTGGGYIILDVGDDRMGKGGHSGHGDYGDGELWRVDEDGGRGSTLKVIREGDENGSGNGNGGNRYGTTDDGKSTRAGDLHGRRSRLGGGGGGDGLDGDGGRDGLLGNSSGPTNGARIWSGRKHRLGSSHGNRGGSGRKDYGGDSDSDLGTSRSHLSSDNLGDGAGGGKYGDGDGERGLGDGESSESKGRSKHSNVDRKGRRQTDGSLDKLKGKGSRGGEGEHDGDDGDKLKKSKKKSKKTKSSVDEGDGEGDGTDGGKGRKTRGIMSLRGDTQEEEDTTKQHYSGELRRLRPKKNDVKALSCTLKELKDIDPLDYLAKYCILNPKKMPEYRRVYDNVDRDEDDEINISELDFALKSVNYDLISDPELSYVHSILELAGRWKLNFRLFSLIAALSEKVVALEDMVKKLINGMDCQALEVKMKKCKELFYLLDSMDSTGRGGVVTTDSLSVELQAGGLTQEHVLYVVDRLNYEGKGIVEFLDYLTYVPLFVEIHDSICGNPLDVTRTK